MVIPTNTTYVDAADERRIQLRGALIAQNRGDLPVRWVDVMPAVVADPWADRVARQSKPSPAVQEIELSESLRKRRIRDNRRYAREQERLRNGRTREEIAAERTAARVARMTPLQKMHHDYYVKNRERILQRMKEKGSGR
jgi:hypothetical protein